VAGFCEHGSGPAGPVEYWEILEWLSEYWLLRKDSAPWIQRVIERARVCLSLSEIHHASHLSHPAHSGVVHSVWIILPVDGI
jgi:hypothetical protein